MTAREMSVPHSVARGIVRCGSMTLSRGTVADSRPSSAHSVSVADAVTAESERLRLHLDDRGVLRADEDQREHDDREQRQELENRRDELKYAGLLSRRAS